MRGLIDLVDTVIAAPTQPAMSVEYARRHIRAIGHQDDVMIASWIGAATSWFDEQTSRQLITSTREVWMDTFPMDYYGLAVGPGLGLGLWGFGAGLRIELPHPPLQQVLSIKYIDSNGVLQSVSDGGSPDLPLYQFKAPAGPYARRGWVEPLPATSWPIVQWQNSGAVRIQYTCGYGDDMTTIPDLILGVIAYLVGNFDQYRTSIAFRTGFGDFPLGVQMLVDGFKYSAYPTHAVRQWGSWGTGRIL